MFFTVGKYLEKSNQNEWQYRSHDVKGMNKGEELFSIKNKKHGSRGMGPDVKLSMSKAL